MIVYARRTDFCSFFVSGFPLGSAEGGRAGTLGVAEEAFSASSASRSLTENLMFEELAWFFSERSRYGVGSLPGSSCGIGLRQ